MFRNSNRLKHQSLHFPSPHSVFMKHESDRRYNSGMTVHEKFVSDMRVAGIVTAAYRGRFFWEGPAVRSNQQHGPTLQDIIGKTAVPLQWDARNSNYIVYPSGPAGAGWKEVGADSEGEEFERDGYNDAYAAKTPKSGYEEDED
jgi:hypothetical protein